MSGEAAYLLALMSVRGIGPIGAVSVARKFRTAGDLADAAATDLEETLGDRCATLLRQRSTDSWKFLLMKAQSRIDHHLALGIRPIAITEDDYPPLLRHIGDPPPILYAKGNVEALNILEAIAVVGTRNPTEKGEKVASTVARYFATSGFVVVSGLAHGIDSAAHRAACESGRTVAVLANSLDKVYPAENRQLAERIIQRGGALVGELALDEKTFRNAFVRRDRIQSGMSLAVIPVQTDLEGGTMHTVRFAEEQERLLFCPVPLNLETEKKQYAGIWQLIRSNRAKPFHSQDYPELLAIVQDHKLKLMREYGLKEIVCSAMPPPSKEVSAADVALGTERLGPDKRSALRKLEDTCRELGLDANKEEFGELMTQLRKRLFGGAKRANKKQRPVAAEEQPKLID
jgi:DNA protecting protein DprA